MERRVLCLDCDGVIFNTVHMIQEIIAKINYCCSQEFQEKNIDRALQNNQMELYDKYRRIRKITIDEVLEETRDIYKNRIRYDEMYVYKNTFYGVIEMIAAICEARIFDKIYITTHVNSLQEVLAKTQFFGDYLPQVEVFTIPFNSEPYDPDKRNYYENFNRKRTNKPAEFFKAKGEDPANTIFIDDSESICSQARELGAVAYICNSKTDDPLSVFEEMLENLGKRVNIGETKKMTLF